MLLSKILKGANVLNNYEDVEVEAISYKNEHSMQSNVFVCLSGVKVDGHEFARGAVEKGAVAIVCERDVGIGNVVIVDDSRAALARMAKNYFNSPTDEIKLVAVTGTNGKTSVATIINYVLNKIEHKCALFSTVKIEYDGQSIEPITTTPGAYYLMSMLRKMADCGCEFAVMEASSHALEQRRLSECFYEVGIFTNLTQDHLDYHGDMERYYAAKRKLFNISKFGIINIDNSYGKRLTEEISIPFYTYSMEDKTADFAASNIRCDINGVSFNLVFSNIHVKVKLAIPGIYAVENALAAIAACVRLGAPIQKVVACLNEFGGIDGRCEIIKTDTDFTVICDYAHTPDGIVNILNSVKQYANARIISLFGCGGDRDKTKRPLMAEAVTSLSDFTIITSDNPRTEEPQAIIDDILKGVNPQREYIAIENRKQAIHYALDMAKSGDVIVLLGKGHERYQIVGQTKFDFDERTIVKEYLKGELHGGLNE